jgi:dolichyl-phosphate beta-glucosyltransferase
MHARPPQLSVVIPAYNEAGRIDGALAEMLAFARGFEDTFAGGLETIVVDDGSADETAAKVRAFAEAHPEIDLRVIELGRNRGKGAAVRTGMLAAGGVWRLMCDADMATPIEEFAKLRAHLERGARVVIGSREMPDSRLEPPQPWRRRLSGRVFRAIRRGVMLGRSPVLVEVRDSQCGFKCFEGALAARVFELQTDEGFAFDCEALALAGALGERAVEVGVVWRDNRDSRVKLVRDSVRMLRELFRLRARLKGLDVGAAPEPMSVVDRSGPPLVEVRPVPTPVRSDPP